MVVLLLVDVKIQTCTLVGKVSLTNRHHAKMWLCQWLILLKLPKPPEREEGELEKAAGNKRHKRGIKG